MAIDARELIIGTWRLVHSVEIQPGREKYYPFGKGAIGYLVYTDAGVMSVQITRNPRLEPPPRSKPIIWRISDITKWT
jgi:hypothetical protein